ncbi:MAG: hypothetical protein JRJ76_14455 [Deltaproteobacteria bacterium]|nr:hypothetical protein [Deltaproteobacteria bacterium]
MTFFQEIHLSETELPLGKIIMIKNVLLQKALQWGVSDCQFIRAGAMSPKVGSTDRHCKRLVKNGG